MARGLRPRVAVIGGGWAGCAAAMTLAQAGVGVVLFERAAVLGGRARTVEIDGRRLDNGQHILLGAYTRTLELIARARGEPGSRDAGLLRLPLTLDRPPDFRLACPQLPAPLHLLTGLLRARGLDWRDKWAAARWARTALKSVPEPDIALARFLADEPERVREALWNPLCLAALNTQPEAASTQVFLQVLSAAFGRKRAHSDLLFPQTDLGAVFPEPAARRIVEHGGKVRLNTPVVRVTDDADALCVHTPHGVSRFDRIIVAVAPQHLAGLCSALPGLGENIRKVAMFRYEPIATIYLQYPATLRLARPMLALSGGPAQFVFDRGQTHGQAGLLACVCSAASPLLGEARSNWITAAERQVVRIADVAEAHWRKAIFEKQAGYACVPALARPCNRTSHPRVWLAGDYTAGPYPATLESATLSGVESAQTLIADL